MLEKICNTSQMCSVRKLKFYDGREGDERIIVVDNGCLSFTLLQDHGLDIHDFRYKGLNIAYLSKNGLFGYNTEFHNRFNGGMLYTCGLDTLGGRQLPIHGKYHNLPAEIDSIICNEKFVEINATIKDVSLGGQSFVVNRKIYCEYGSSKITIENRVTNTGFVDDQYCLMFHMNIGYPMLDEGVKVVADIIETKPRTEHASKSIDKCLIIESPLAEFDEEVYFHKVKEGKIQVVNEKLKKVVSFNYDVKQFPNFIEWKFRKSGDYALGIEPSTTTLEDEFEKTTLKPQETHNFKMEIEVSDI